MSIPDQTPKKTVAGIAVDPRTLQRVIPESKRADGTVRQQRKVRPGFTPQEDVSLFRGSRQQAADTKGHVPGWAPPSSKKPGTSSGGSVGSDGAPLSKSAAKNAKRKAKKQAEKEKTVRDNWDSEGEGDIEERAVEKSTSGKQVAAVEHTDSIDSKDPQNSSNDDKPLLETTHTDRDDADLVEDIKKLKVDDS